MSKKMVLAVLGLFVLALAACGDSASDEPATLALTVTDDGATGLPSTLEAGLYAVTVTNSGAAERDLELIESDGQATFLADFNALIEGAPFPDYLEQVAGIGLVPAGGSLSTTMTLNPAGEYSLVDTAGEAPVVLGTVEVTGAAVETSALPDGATLTIRDYGFELEGVGASTETLTVVNAGPLQPHHVVMLPFPAGTDAAAAEESIRTLLTLDEGAEPPEGIVMPDEGSELYSSVYSPGNGGTLPVSFEAGRTYAFMCFISDRQGGPPHAIGHDMLEIVTIDA